MKNKELQFISQLPNYTFKFTFIRVFFVSIVGLIFMFIATNNIKTDIPTSAGKYIRVMLIFVFLAETNVFIDYISERFLPIPDKIGIRVIVHIVVSITLAGIVISTLEMWVDHNDLLKEPIVRIMIVLGVVFIFMLIIFTIGIRITEKWINSQKELEQLKQAKLLSDFNALQDQLNPHFLFNSLSVLKSMIIYDSNAAVNFTQNLTDVYRYVLQSREKTTVKLSEELSFIHSYIGIYKDRHGESLKVDIQVKDEYMDRKIPPLALQLLVENAIKHNIAGKSNPLLISIITKKGALRVKNNLQLKDSTYSTRNGLKNLIKRFEILTDRQVIISSDQEFYQVEIPLLN
jgi:two-component system, LytTR family, sensor kinase